MSDTNERSVASAGSVASGVVEHAKKCVDFWRSMMDGADRIGMEAPSLAIGGVSDLVDGLLAEIERLRPTDAERKAIGNAAAWMSTRLDGESAKALASADIMRDFLVRTK